MVRAGEVILRLNVCSGLCSVHNAVSGSRSKPRTSVHNDVGKAGEEVIVHFATEHVMAHMGPRFLRCYSHDDGRALRSAICSMLVRHRYYATVVDGFCTSTIAYRCRMEIASHSM